MGRSFYYGTDAQLFTGSAAFATKVSANPTSYGLTAPMAAAYQTVNDLYADAYLAALDPEQRTKPKIQAKNDARQSLVLKAAELAKIVEATPTVTNEQKLDLGLSVRGIPQPVTELGTPTDCKVTLEVNGAVTLKWKCASPRATGMVYQVFRRIGEGQFEYLGGTGEKKITDSTLPKGSSEVVYQIQAVRSTATGPWAQFNVNFGTTSAGAMMVQSVTESKPTKLAA